MLEISKLFFHYLNSQNIRYCHWKSNFRLDKALEGETDLDLLVHDDDKAKFHIILKKFNIIKILSPPAKCFPAMEDYLGFDEKTGKFIHLHIHYKLILGQRYVKNHHVPIEDLILNNLTTKHGVYIPIPEIELILLAIRANMKISTIPIIKHATKDLFYSKSGYTAFPGDIEKELMLLIDSTDHTKLGEYLIRSKISVSEERLFDFFFKFQNKKLKWFDILLLNRYILRCLKGYRRDKSPIATIQYVWQILCNLTIIKKIIPPGKKTLPGRGFSFSIIGADGSGKSTLTCDLIEWLSWKLFTKFYYYGIPKNLIVKLFRIVARVCVKIKLLFVSELVDSIMWIGIARNRYKISQKIKTDVVAGKVVITDRFPLRTFRTMQEPMDGPRLSHLYSKIGIYCSKLESSYYDRLCETDHKYVLQVSIDELRKRKTDLNFKTHEKKATAVNAISSDKHTTLIKADKPYSDVLLEIKRSIWNKLVKISYNTTQN